MTYDKSSQSILNRLRGKLRPGELLRLMDLEPKLLAQLTEDEALTALRMDFETWPADLRAKFEAEMGPLD